jgi:hypothetical protein
MYWIRRRTPFVTLNSGLEADLRMWQCWCPGLEDDLHSSHCICLGWEDDLHTWHCLSPGLEDGLRTWQGLCPWSGGRPPYVKLLKSWTWGRPPYLTLLKSWTGGRPPYVKLRKSWTGGQPPCVTSFLSWSGGWPLFVALPMPWIGGRPWMGVAGRWCRVCRAREVADPRPRARCDIAAAVLYSKNTFWDVVLVYQLLRRRITLLRRGLENYAAPSPPFLHGSYKLQNSKNVCYYIKKKMRLRLSSSARYHFWEVLSKRNFFYI